MPHQSFKLLPGVNHNKTPTLNEGAISQSNLIRFMPDHTGVGLVQKLGGWSLWSSTQISSKIRCLKGWQDLTGTKWLAVGALNSLSVINAASTSSVNPITPSYLDINIAVAGTTTIGSPLVSFVSTGITPTAFDVVHFKAHISIGGVVLFGLYQCIPVGANQFQISTKDLLGNPVAATAAVAGGGATETFTTAANSAIVTVTLASHGYHVGDTYTCLVATAVGGTSIAVTDYEITSVPTTNTFTIVARNSATSIATVPIGGGTTNWRFWLGAGPTPTGAGFGRGAYGGGGFGTSTSAGITPTVGTPITVTDYSLDTWGHILVACGTDTPLFFYDPVYNFPTMSAMANGPPANNALFVAMPQQQIVALGSCFFGVQDPLLVRWCDAGDYTVWVAKTDNQAGSRRLPRGSAIIGGMQAGHRGLIWTDLGLWTMLYIGYPLVYNIDEVAQGCGLIARKAMAELSGTVYWMGQKQFFKYSDSGVQPIECPVWDVAFQQLDTTNIDKIRCAANAAFNEVTWYLPVIGGTGENAVYVKYNIMTETWDYGTLSRTAWINQSVLGMPIGACDCNYIYQHEVSNDATSGSVTSAMNPSFQTGYMAMSDGDTQMFVDQVWPDMKWGFESQPQNATVQITFYVADYPGDTPRVYGPFSVVRATQFIEPRFRGRLVSIKVESSDFGTFWRIGNIRYRYQTDGKF